MPRVERLRWAAAVTAAVVLLGGCRGGETSTGAGATSSTAVPSAPTTTAPVTSTTSSGPTTVPRTTVSDGGACPGNDALPPAGADNVTEVGVDVDSDGRDDRALSYQRADGSRRVAVALAAGGTTTIDVRGLSEGPAPLMVLGGAELGGEGETIFVVTGAGASVVVVGLFQFVECAITRVSFTGGGPVELPVGGGVTHGNGILCTGGDDGVGLVELSAMSSDGETFTTADTRYRVDGNTLVEVSSESVALDRTADSGQLDAYYTLNCPSLERSLAG